MLPRRSKVVDNLIEEVSVVPVMSAYATAGLDMTINVISTGIEYVPAIPSSGRSARGPQPSGQRLHGIVRIESPLQWFSRFTMRDVELQGVTLPRATAS